MEPVHVLLSAKVTAAQIERMHNLHPRLVIDGEPGGYAIVDPRELVIDKRDVEIGVMNDQLRAVDKLEKIVSDLRKQRLQDEKIVSDSVDLQRTLINGALGVDVTVEGVLRDATID